MNKLTKIAACIMSVILAVVMLFSIAFVIKSAHHDCVGEGCPICQEIHEAEENLHRISAAFSAIVSCIILCAPAYLCCTHYICVFFKNTPVKLKVQLLN